ncbi:MAG: three-Cys-motif partner protein TcmP [Actinomycetota bacterium]|nr:three-Cys-motif partner protein TcmP [Actinomycetota bacterium]
MADSLPTVWTLKPHTKAKHDLLCRYLGGWFPILSRYRGRVIFLDGFAGPGVYDKGEPGSPVLALETLLNHSYLGSMEDCEFLFVFNEWDTERYASLERVIDDLKQRRGGLPSNVKVGLYNKNFTELAADILEQIEGKSLAPTFAFLDPFGYKDTPIEVIQGLLSFARCELFIYFDFNSAMRFSTSGVVDSRFEALFGTDEFKAAPESGEQRKVFLHDLYQRQLSDVCGFEYVQSFEMINEKNRIPYYLFYCTRNLKGLATMKEAMWKIAPTGDYRFSDMLAGQPILFGEDVDTQPLQDELGRYFAGKSVTITQVEDYVVGHTPFAKTHVKKKTLKLMQEQGQIASPNQRRRGQFPDGTLIQFL